MSDTDINFKTDSARNRPDSLELARSRHSSGDEATIQNNLKTESVRNRPDSLELARSRRSSGDEAVPQSIFQKVKGIRRHSPPTVPPIDTFAIEVRYKEIYCEEYQPGDKFDKFMITMPRNAVAGRMIKNIGGRRDLSIRIPDDVGPGEKVILIAPKAEPLDLMRERGFSDACTEESMSLCSDNI
jgi:hypothetical protein